MGKLAVKWNLLPEVEDKTGAATLPILTESTKKSTITRPAVELKLPEEVS